MSRKAWEDRITAQQKRVDQWQRWHDEAVANSIKRVSGLTAYGWGDPGMFFRGLTQEKKKLEQIQAEARKLLGTKPKGD